MDQIRLKLSGACVGIAGAGGLGSNCAVALARIGVGKLVIADFDRVEQSNLNRQYYFRDQLGMLKVDALKENIRRIDPEILIETHAVILDPDLLVQIYRHCHVVVEAFDHGVMKQMLIETLGMKLQHIPVVCGIGMAGWGRTELLKVESYGNLYICGDQQSGVDDSHPPLAPRVGIVSHMEANQVLALLLDGFEIK